MSESADDNFAMTSDISRWYVVFWPARFPGARIWTLDFWREPWAVGGYRHVSAFGFSPGANAWVHFDPTPAGISLRMVKNGPDADDLISALINGTDVVKINAKKAPLGPIRFAFRGPFTCVTIIKHLIGCDSGAFTPSALKAYLSRTQLECRDALQQCPGSESGESTSP